MREKSTQELEKVLKNTHTKDIATYLSENESSLLTEDKPFSKYVKEKIKERGLRQQDVFLWADIPERYGYKLLSEEKKTRQRDVIIRICYAAEFTLEEVQTSLRLYQMPELYAKIPRDAILMIAFNERPGSVIEVNSLLKEHGVESLRSSGVQE